MTAHDFYSYMMNATCDIHVRGRAIYSESDGKLLLEYERDK